MDHNLVQEVRGPRDIQQSREARELSRNVPSVQNVEHVRELRSTRDLSPYLGRSASALALEPPTNSHQFYGQSSQSASYFSPSYHHYSALSSHQPSTSYQPSYSYQTPISAASVLSSHQPSTSYQPSSSSQTPISDQTPLSFQTPLSYQSFPYQSQNQPGYLQQYHQIYPANPPPFPQESSSFRPSQRKVVARELTPTVQQLSRRDRHQQKLKYKYSKASVEIACKVVKPNVAEKSLALQSLLASKGDYSDSDGVPKITFEKLQDFMLTMNPGESVSKQAIAPVTLVKNNKQEIVDYFRGYQKEFRPKESRYADPQKYKCTLGCPWSHNTKSNWERHERTHYPQRVWDCFHKDCLGKSIRTRVSMRKDLARRHHADHHQDHGEPDLTDRQLDELVIEIHDSLFPRKCVFKGCKRTFTSYDERSVHIEQHLKDNDILCQDRIEKNFASEAEKESHESYLESYAYSLKEKNDDDEGEAHNYDNDDDDDDDDEDEAHNYDYSDYYETGAGGGTTTRRDIERGYDYSDDYETGAGGGTTTRRDIERGAYSYNSYSMYARGYESPDEFNTPTTAKGVQELAQKDKVNSISSTKPIDRSYIRSEFKEDNVKSRLAQSAQSIQDEYDDGIRQQECVTENPIGILDEDVRSIYSYTTLAVSDRTSNRSAFIRMLSEAIQMNGIDGNSPISTNKWLQESLKLFALQLGEHASQKEEYNTMFFVLKYRREIASELQSNWQMEKKGDIQSNPSHINQNEHLGQWQTDQAQDSIASQQDDTTVSLEESKSKPAEDQDHEISEEQCPLDLEFISGSPAYAWLVSRLNCRSILTVPEQDTLTNIEQAVYNCFLGSYHINKETAHAPHTISFEVDLDINEFFERHHFGSAKDVATILRSFLTLTSDGRNVQALTCLQYLRLVWPDSGEIFLKLLTKVAQDETVSINLPGRIIDGWIAGTKMVFSITGNLHSITELGQQLAWIGSVLQSPTVARKVHHCTPTIKDIGVDSTLPLLGKRAFYACKISYTMFDGAKGIDTADCWYNLFCYPVVAQGFPIARRDSNIDGLEIRLGAMLSLCHAEHVSEFEDKIFIKGFSAMFWLSKHQSGLSVWHFSGDVDGAYISSSEIVNAYEDKALGAYDILRDRHFVGWCSQFAYKAGVLDGNYDIQPSGLSHAQYGGPLSDTNIRRPVRYPNEEVCILDHKENSWRRTPGQTYQQRLEWIHKRPIVLWDTEHRRGWLLNGTSALLHLVFASLQENDGPFDSTYCLQWHKIKQYPSSPENAAARLLRDEDNLELPIRKHGGESEYLKQRIEDMYSLLRLVIEIQISRFRDSKTMTKILDGWDFVDIADITHDPLHARSFELDKDCSGWMHLLRDTYSVTLFGENFGEIFSPINSSLCQGWSALPPQNCYLAASMKDLDLISRAYGGNKKAIPRKLTENTTWAILQDKFDICECSRSHTEHSNLVQVLAPRSRFQNGLVPSDRLSAGPSDGVVIFGQVNATDWVQPSHPSLSEGRLLKRQRRDSNSGLQDNGIVKSASNMSTTRNDDPPKPEEYFIAIVCALRKELRAVRLLFDQTYKNPKFDKHDRHHYAFGRIHSHNVVAACLPGTYGTCSATRVTSELYRSFPMVKYCLLVGIGAGIPSDKNDIRLGDVVVSYPESDHSGMIKYDFEKLLHNGETKRLGSFIQPPRELVSALGILVTGSASYTEPLQKYLKIIADAEEEYCYPGENFDRLFAPSSIHVPGMTTCETCSGLQQRKSTNCRKPQHPRIHLGLIASGDKVVKNAQMRDKLGSEYNALCIDMEAAGVANVLPCLVIRGICDYADSHKYDIWQEYASATAAGFAKLLLGEVRIV